VTEISNYLIGNVNIKTTYLQIDSKCLLACTCINDKALL